MNTLTVKIQKIQSSSGRRSHELRAHSRKVVLGTAAATNSLAICFTIESRLSLFNLKLARIAPIPTIDVLHAAML